MIYNAEYVIAAYAISLGLIAVYALGLFLRHKKINAQSKQLDQAS